MRERTRHDAHAWGAMVVLGAGIVAEGTRVVGDRPWPGFNPMWSHAASVLLVLLWSASIASIVLRHRSRAFARAAWFLAIVSPISMVVHASVTRVGGSSVGLVYFVGAAALVFALKRTFDRGARHYLPDQPPGDKPLRPQAPGAHVGEIPPGTDRGLSA